MNVQPYFRSILLALVLPLLAPALANAHCDSLDGPVVTDARKALERKDVTTVLKWVDESYEEQIRRAFTQTLAVRTASPAARELADTYFFETLVRLHRAGEGAPYTGLKPAGTDVGPAVAASDRALKTGSADEVVHLVTNAVTEGIRHRFERSLETRKHAGHGIQPGRKSVAAYVEFVHYVERLYHDASGTLAHHSQSGEPSEHP